jgi:hypothetical protein
MTFHIFAGSNWVYGVFAGYGVLRCVVVWRAQDSGALMQQRRLEKEPSCLAAYQGGVGTGHNFVLAFRDLTLQVYVNFQLVWAVTVSVGCLLTSVPCFFPYPPCLPVCSIRMVANVIVSVSVLFQTPNIPVHIHVSDFGKQRGLIVAIDETGALTACCYVVLSVFTPLAWLLK